MSCPKLISNKKFNYIFDTIHKLFSIFFNVHAYAYGGGGGGGGSMGIDGGPAASGRGLGRGY